MTKDQIGGIMVSVLTSSVVVRGVRAKTGWLRIRIMCLSGATCLHVHVDCCFSEL